MGLRFTWGATPPRAAGRLPLRWLSDALDRFRGELWRREYMPKVRPLPMARELVLRVRRDGKRVALATSGKEDEANLREAGCIAIYRDPADLPARYGESPLAGRGPPPAP